MKKTAIKDNRGYLGLVEIYIKQGKYTQAQELFKEIEDKQ